MSDYCAKRSNFATALPGNGQCYVLKEAQKAYLQTPMNLDNSSKQGIWDMGWRSPQALSYTFQYIQPKGREPFSNQRFQAVESLSRLMKQDYHGLTPFSCLNLYKLEQ